MVQDGTRYPHGLEADQGLVLVGTHVVSLAKGRMAGSCFIRRQAIPQQQMVKVDLPVPVCGLSANVAALTRKGAPSAGPRLPLVSGLSLQIFRQFSA